MLWIKNVLNAQEIAHCQQLLATATWADGTLTAGVQAAKVKNNRQLAETDPIAEALRKVVLSALGRNATFFSAALPKKVYPPMFNQYQGSANAFGNHVDNAVRTHPVSATHLRTDLSFTLFLTNPEDYTGGELIIENGLQAQTIKLPAGDLILYPSYSLHRVEPVTEGQRIACFSWLQSMVRETEQRETLYQLDSTVMTLRHQNGDTLECVALTNIYHNLLRMWVEI